VATAMAEGVRSRFRANLGVAITGIAGPKSDDSDKPVGLTYVAVASELGTAAYGFNFNGDRDSIRRQAATAAIRILLASAVEPAAKL
jgi:PncC family amidohydrolase